MPEDEKAPSSLKTVVAIATIAVSLFGNIIQAGFLVAKRAEIKQKDTELSQAQTKIYDAERAIDRKREAAAAQIENYKSRMAEIESELTEATRENQQGLTGTLYGEPEDKAHARHLIQDSSDRHVKLLEEKKELQDKIDILQLNIISQ